MIALVIDIETTGFDRSIDPKTGYLRDGNEILEVGFLRIDTDTRKIVSHGTLYFYKPHFPVENDAQRVHGLTRAFLEQYEKDFDKNLVILNALIQNTCIIGKNSDAFDIPFIEKFIEKYSRGSFIYKHAFVDSKVTLFGSKQRFYYENSSVSQDVQTLFRDTFNSLKASQTGDFRKRAGSLSEYIEAIGWTKDVDRIYAGLTKDRETGAHGALYDCVMTYVVWVWLLVNKRL